MSESRVLGLPWQDTLTQHVWRPVHAAGYHVEQTSKGVSHGSRSLAFPVDRQMQMSGCLSPV